MSCDDTIRQADLCIEWLLQFAPEGAFQEWLEAQPWYDIPEPPVGIERGITGFGA